LIYIKEGYEPGLIVVIELLQRTKNEEEEALRTAVIFSWGQMEVWTMIAADIMVREVVTIGPDESVARAAALITANDVSALPVIGTDGRLTGIISEADLLRRKEIATATNRPSWVETITPATTVAADFVKAHGKRVADLMSKDVISVGETAALNDIAAIPERNRIKRVPVVRGDQLVGIVSRSNLIQALASAVITTEVPSDESRSVRGSPERAILDRFRQPQCNREQWRGAPVGPRPIGR
jgi:CBS domain-containing protein